MPTDLATLDLSRVPAAPREPGPAARALIFDGLPRRTIGSAGVVALCLGVVGWLAHGDRLTPQRTLLLLPAALALAWLVRTVFIHRNGIRAFRHGVPALARIVSRATTLRRAGALDQPRLVLTWELTVDGSLHQGSVSSRDHGLLARLFPGDELVVLHLPASPGVSCAWVDEALALRRPGPAPAPQPGSPEPAGVPPPPRQAGFVTQSVALASTGPEDTQLVKGGAALALSLLFTLIFGWGYAGELLIETAPVACSGVVTVREANPMVRSNGRDATRISYGYRRAGVDYEGSVNTTDDALIARAAPGSALPVESSATFPSISRLRGESYSMLGFGGGSLLALLVIGVAVVGTVLVIPPLLASRRRRRAHREGRAARGRVVERSLDLEPDEPRRRGRIDYEYTVDGQVLLGSLTSWNHRLLDQAVPRDELTVLYLPEEPAVHVLFVPDDFPG